MKVVDKTAYNLALSIYSHIRHEDFLGAEILIKELQKLVEDKVKEIKAKELVS